jgi:hypothetical protein
MYMMTKIVTYQSKMNMILINLNLNLNLNLKKMIYNLNQKMIHQTAQLI